MLGDKVSLLDPDPTTNGLHHNILPHLYIESPNVPRADIAVAPKIQPGNVSHKAVFLAQLMPY